MYLLFKEFIQFSLDRGRKLERKNITLFECYRTLLFLTLFLYIKSGRYCRNLEPTKSAAMSGILVKVFSRIRHQIRREFSSFVAKSIATAPPIKIVKEKTI